MFRLLSCVITLSILFLWGALLHYYGNTVYYHTISILLTSGNYTVCLSLQNMTTLQQFTVLLQDPLQAHPQNQNREEMECAHMRYFIRNVSYTLHNRQPRHPKTRLSISASAQATQAQNGPQAPMARGREISLRAHSRDSQPAPTESRKISKNPGCANGARHDAHMRRRNNWRRAPHARIRCAPFARNGRRQTGTCTASARFRSTAE